MAATGDDDDDSGSFEKTNIYRSDTLKVKMDPNYRVPPCLVLLVGPSDQMGRQWLIQKPIQTIGRNPASEIHILDVSLSKQHARIESATGIVEITDLGATNTTLVNDTPLTPNVPYTLKNNDQIRAGGLVFKFLERGILSETKEKERMQSELETARSVQETLLPEVPQAQYQWVQIGGRYASASECGGDWWWHWACADKAFAIIGDATGHGAAAALITSAARSAMTTMEDDVSVGIEKVYSTLSQTIRKCSGGKLAMSAFIVEVDLKTRRVKYINASHLPAVIFTGDPKKLAWNKLDLIIEPISPPFGSIELSCKVAEFAAAPGSRLVLLTDGLTERNDSNGDMLKERNFYNMLIEAHAGHVKSQSDFLDTLLQKSNHLAHHAPQDDDITVVALDFA